MAIPIISAGNYGFPFKLAARIAIASLGNALLSWRSEDPEMFDRALLNRIYFCVYNPDPAKYDANFREAKKIWKEYALILSRNHRVVYQNSFLAHIRYMVEIKRYDEQRGYFSVTKGFRFLLLLLRIIFMPIVLLKDGIGKYDWQKRRIVVEWVAFVKLLLPAVTLIYIFVTRRMAGADSVTYIVSGITLYMMLDTLTYLLVLIVHADIQRPSANIIRTYTSLIAQQTRLSEWAEMVRNCQNRPQGMKIEEWCQQHDITKASYYWRLRKVREAFLATAGNTPDFIEVPFLVIQSETIEPKHKTVAVIRGKNHLTFEITDQASASFLRTLFLRLNSLNYTQRQIAASVHSSRNTISEVLYLADAKGLRWPLDDTVTNQEIMSLLYPQRKDAVNPRKEPDYSYIHKELAKPGVNLSLLWPEYCSKCDSEGCTPYMYSQFCDKYRHWARLTKATMRIKLQMSSTFLPYTLKKSLPHDVKKFLPRHVKKLLTLWL